MTICALEEENAMFAGDNVLGREYRSSELRQEWQILQALRVRGKKSGSLSVKELVTAVYGDKLGGPLREKALEPFIDEVLRKLAGDGLIDLLHHSSAMPTSPPQRPATGAAPQKLRDSCYLCVASKVRCDKVKPVCGRCTKRGTPCEYVATKRAGQSPRPSSRLPSEMNMAIITSGPQQPSPQFDSRTNLDFPLDLPSAAFEAAATRPVSDADFDSIFSSIVSIPGLVTPSSTELTSPFSSSNFDTTSFSSNPFAITEEIIVKQHAQLTPLHVALTPTACPLAATSGDDQLIQFPRTQSICCCIIRALTLLKTLVPDSWTTCDRSKGNLESNAVQAPALARVLAENKRSIDEVMEMLECSCARDGYLLFVVAIIVFKLLGLYARVARQTGARVGDRSLLKYAPDGSEYCYRCPEHSSSSSSSTIVETQDYGDCQRRIALQQVLGELHRGQRLINTLSQHLAAHKRRQLEDLATRISNSQAPLWDIETPFSALMLEQLEADLRKRLRALSNEIIEMLREESADYHAALIGPIASQNDRFGEDIAITDVFAEACAYISTRFAMSATPTTTTTIPTPPPITAIAPVEANKTEIPFTTAALEADIAFWEFYVASRPSPSEDFFRQICAYHSAHAGPHPIKGVAHDVGTGPGNIARRLAPYFAQVVGSDLNGGALAAARVLTTPADAARTTYVQSKAEDLASVGVLPPAVGIGQTDVVTVSECMPLLDPAAALAAFHALLRPGGTLAIYFYGGPIFTDGPSPGACDEAYENLANRISQCMWPCAGTPSFPFYQRAYEAMYSWLDNIALPADQWQSVERHKWNADRMLLFNGPAGVDFDLEYFWADHWDFARVHDYLASVFPNYRDRATDERKKAVDDALHKLKETMAGARRKVTFPVVLVLATRK
ncbi:hypothetical protein DV738_g541, partial [Chaetothyriales sp. CBS 135597]